MVKKLIFAPVCILGTDLPISISGHQVVTSSDKQVLYTVGQTNLDFKYIFMHSCNGTLDNCKWETADVKLQYGRYSAVAMLMPDELINKLCVV